MNRLAAFACILVLLAVPAFGAGNKPQAVIIRENLQVGSTQLAAGTYKLAFTGAGSGVQVTLTQAGKTVITFAAKAVAQKNNPGVNLYTNAGVVNLETINLDKVSLQLEGAPHPGQ
ncbi:MAG: hypothetical protein ABSG84_18660 [Acidobacteriaceae bacterium]|jgi:hypothetical protein